MITRRKIARPIRYSAQHTYPTTEMDLPIDKAISMWQIGYGIQSGLSVAERRGFLPTTSLSRPGRDDCALGAPTLNETFQN
jgi:hypothetical protein